MATITTIEQALAAAGREVGKKDITSRAREAVESGETLEITITVAPEKGGATATLLSQRVSRVSHGRLIKLK